MFAGAPFHKFFLINFHHYRCKRGAAVRTVAKRLLRAPATCTPEIGAGFCFEFYGPEAGDYGGFSVDHYNLSMVKAPFSGFKPRYQKVFPILINVMSFKKSARIFIFLFTAIKKFSGV